MAESNRKLRVYEGRVDHLRSALSNLLFFARGNQPVLDQIHRALDDDEEMARRAVLNRGESGDRG